MGVVRVLGLATFVAVFAPPSSLYLCAIRMRADEVDVLLLEKSPRGKHAQQAAAARRIQNAYRQMPASTPQLQRQAAIVNTMQSAVRLGAGGGRSNRFAARAGGRLGVQPQAVTPPQTRTRTWNLLSKFCEFTRRTRLDNRKVVLETAPECCKLQMSNMWTATYKIKDPSYSNVLDENLGRRFLQDVNNLEDLFNQENSPYRDVSCPAPKAKSLGNRGLRRAVSMPTVMAEVSRQIRALNRSSPALNRSPPVLAEVDHHIGASYTPKGHVRLLDVAVSESGVALEAWEQELLRNGIRDPDGNKPVKACPDGFDSGTMTSAQLQVAFGGSQHSPLSPCRIAAQPYHGSPYPLVPVQVEGKHGREMKLHSVMTNAQWRDTIVMTMAAQYYYALTLRRGDALRRLGNLFHTLSDTYSDSHVRRSTGSDCQSLRVEWPIGMDTTDFVAHVLADLVPGYFYWTRMWLNARDRMPLMERCAANVMAQVVRRWDHDWKQIQAAQSRHRNIESLTQDSIKASISMSADLLCPNMVLAIRSNDPAGGAPADYAPLGVATSAGVAPSAYTPHSYTPPRYSDTHGNIRPQRVMAEPQRRARLSEWARDVQRDPFHVPQGNSYKASGVLFASREICGDRSYAFLNEYLQLVSRTPIPAEYWVPHNVAR